MMIARVDFEVTEKDKDVSGRNEEGSEEKYIYQPSERQTKLSVRTVPKSMWYVA